MCQNTTIRHKSKQSKGSGSVSASDATSAVLLREVNEVNNNATVEKSKDTLKKGKSKSTFTKVAETHSIEREWWVDIIAFMFPLLFSRVTNVMPIYATGIGRLVFTRLFMSLHYIFVDKDKYMTKLTQRQLTRERMDYTIGAILHMNIQVVLQRNVLFPK